MFRRNKKARAHSEGENPFLLTFSDFMASLLAIFILVLIITLIQLNKQKDILIKQQSEMNFAKEELINSLEEIRNFQLSIDKSLSGVTGRELALKKLLLNMQEELQKQGVEIVLVENGFHIPEKELQFALGRHEIPAIHAQTAYTLGKVLLFYLSNPENLRMMDTIFIEGHTDSVPNTREMGNWGLSTYRAIALWNFWTDKPGELAELKNLTTIPDDPETPAKPLISVSGYADTRSTHGLLNLKKLKDDRPEDRRIDIRFTLVSSEKQSLQGLRENMTQMQEKMDGLINKLKAPKNAL
jgi:flagellar motor protein MotB